MKRILFILGFLAMVSSCNSDDDSSQQSNFYALNVGNSWVYKYYKYNLQTQIYDETAVTKSLSIVGTEEIYGNLFYKFKSVVVGNDDQNNTFLFPSNGESFYYLRESDGDLIDSNGGLYFTNNNYDEIFIKEQPYFTIYSQLQSNTESITTDAGTFDCIYAKRYAKYTETGVQTPAEDKYYYKDGIGLIQSSLSYVSNPTPVIKQRLVSYNIQ